MPKQDGGLQWSVRPLHHLREHRDPVDVMAWSPDGGTLVTGADKGLYIWNTRVSVFPACSGTQLIFPDWFAKTYEYRRITARRSNKRDTVEA